MVDCWLPYGDTEVYVSVEIENLLGIAELKLVEPEKTAVEIISDTLIEPSGKTIEELLTPGVKVAIAVDIYSHPYAVTQALTELTKTLMDLIVPRDRIAIIVGNGENEKENSRLKEAITKVPELRNIMLIDHNRNTSELTNLGETHRGTPVEINKRYQEATLKIAIGETRVDPLTGYAGAHSAVVPGLASSETIKEYRRNYFNADITPGSIEFNPLKEDVLEAVNKVGIDFALNIITNNDGRMIAAHGGLYDETWGNGINSLADMREVSTKGGADIVVTSAGGDPFDQSLYPATWALINAVKATKKNGTIVLLAQCKAGLGAEAYTQLARVSELKELQRRYMFGTEALYLMKQVLKNNRIILVSALSDYLVESIGLDTARTANEAYKKAIQSRRSRKTVVIPHGCSSIWA
ncbi:lactate racemase domain-containing protein [Thermoproteota archaeon]